MSVTFKSIFACAIINYILVTETVLSSPGRAPGCVESIGLLRPAMGIATGELGYVIQPESTTYTPGKSMNIRISNPNPAITTIMGILLYVMPESDNQKRVGTWVVPESLQDNSPNCGGNITAGPQSVLTHTNPSPKPLLNVDMVWTPSAELTGNMNIRCTVVGNAIDNWQIMNFVLTPEAGAAPPAAAPIAAAPVAGQRKCKTFRKKMSTYGESAGAAVPIATALVSTAMSPSPTAALDSYVPVGVTSATPPLNGTSAEPATQALPSEAAASVDPAVSMDPSAPVYAEGTSESTQTGLGASSVGTDGADAALEQSTDPNDPSNIAVTSGSSHLWQAPYALCLIAIFAIIH